MTLVSLFQFSCSSTGNNNSKDNTTGDKDVKWEVVAKGSQCPVKEAKQLVIKDQSAYDSFWAKNFENSEIPVEKPVINFSEKWVIAAFKGNVSTGGHDVEIKSIVQSDKNTVVTIKHIKPGQGCMSSMAEESPFLIATINHIITDQIKFEIIQEEKKCE
jgi:hypothetical protein